MCRIPNGILVGVVGSSCYQEFICRGLLLHPFSFLQTFELIVLKQISPPFNLNSHAY